MTTRKIFILLLNIFSSGFLFSQVQFSSDFESASIGSVKLLDSVWIKSTPTDSMLSLSYEISSRFDPLNPVDTSLSPSARWYYFRITGVKGKQIFLNIRNSEAIRPFYSYDNKNFQRFEFVENINKGQINKIFTQDTVYICHFIPYTCSHLDKKYKEWSESKYMKTEVIGKSQQGRDIRMMTLTDWSADDTNKKRVWIHGRVHPSEHPSSWHLEFLIEKLLDGSIHSRAMLASTIFYIVPFANPDGVYGGFSRSTSTGVNIEINWDRPDSLTMPEVKALRGKIESLTKDRPFDLFLNMHSQISGTITYWIHTAESTSGLMFRKQILLSALTINENPWFSPADLSFSGVAPRYVEGWIWDRSGNNTVAITFETPYTYYKDNKNGEWVSLENLKSLAGNSLNAISDYLEISSDSRILADVKVSRPSAWKKAADDSMAYFGDECLITDKVRQKVRAKVGLPEAGTYRVYTWVAGSVDNWSDNLVNRWKEIGSVTVSKKRTYKWRGSSDQLNGVADKLLFLK